MERSRRPSHARRRDGLAPLDGLRPSAQFIEDAAILLIVGGLLMLGLVVLLVVLRAVFPAGRSGQGDRVHGRLDRALVTTPSLPPTGGKLGKALPLLHEAQQEGWRTGRRMRPKDVDEILATIENNGWGQARLMRLLEDATVVRYYTCSECNAQVPRHGGCAFQAGFLQGALGRLFDERLGVEETACRSRGDPVCEFEVRL